MEKLNSCEMVLFIVRGLFEKSLQSKRILVNSQLVSIVQEDRH